ncbi:MAG: septum formation protein Maf [Candidatus Omnitrophica bacterium]|nr:septum formation protein Maf [Candidatus Omnitrophota bacterium]
MKKIILASKSKRRSEILRQVGIPHLVVPSGVGEDHRSARHIRRIVVSNAKKKAIAVSKKKNSGIVIGVDTMVLFKGKLIGKPKNVREARKMLLEFRGRRLEVYSGLHVIDSDNSKSVSGSDKTTLYVKSMPISDLEKYFKLLGPYDKAGGFSIEGVGSIIFDDLRGSYFNVLGLPMHKLQELFRKIGLDLLDFIS